MAAHAQHGTDYRIARLSDTYGPGMAREDARVQAYFLRQALAGEDIVLQSDGTLERTYTYVADAASALLAMVLTERSGTNNVANEDATVSVRELAETCQRQSPVPGDRVEGPGPGRRGRRAGSSTTRDRQTGNPPSSSP